jgi:hypothetical protein
MATDRLNTEQLPLSDGIQQAHQLLAERHDLQTKLQNHLAALRREDFQSPDFSHAGYHLYPNVYGTSDRSLWQLEFTDNTKVFLLTGKISSGNPYELGYSAVQGLDLRKTVTTIIEWDGGTLKAEGPEGTDTYTGELAKPETFLRFARSTLGTPAADITFI